MSTSEFWSTESSLRIFSQDRGRARATPWLDGTGAGSFPSMSENLKTRLRNDLAVARKARNRLETVVLTTLLSEVRNREIEVGEEVGDEDVQAIVVKAIKQRRDSAQQMLDGGRPELAEKELEEATMLQTYLPAPFSEAEVRAMVREAIADGATEMGAVMGRIMPRIRGRFEGKEANRLVREELV
jgi:uncharacterized protein YqeY